MGELKIKVNGVYIPAGWLGGASPLLSWPVGSIFMSAVPTDPSILLGGGTWVRWGKGRMPVSLDEAQTEFDTVEETGGEKTHILTTAEMPSHGHTINHDHPNTSTSSDGDHNHTFYFQYSATTTAGGTTVRITDIMNVTGGSGTGYEVTIRNSGAHTHTLDVPAYSGSSGNTGGDGAHNNLPPYITCYMWKRTA
jgi:microcystin-dependent protein